MEIVVTADNTKHKLLSREFPVLRLSKVNALVVAGTMLESRGITN